MIELTNEYREIAKCYKKMFGYGVPLSMIPPITEMTDLIAKIQECLDEEADTLLEKLGVKIDAHDLL